MKNTMKRLLALLLAMLLALPSFALADEDGKTALPPEETPIEAYVPEVELDLADIDTGDADNGLSIEPEEAFEEIEPLPDGFVRVSVAVTPADAVVSIFAVGAEAPMETRLDADWLLKPGTYQYSAWAEGYVPAECVNFEVPEQDAPFELVIELEQAAESDDGIVEAPAEEPVEENVEEPETSEGTEISEETEVSKENMVPEETEVSEENENREETETPDSIPALQTQFVRVTVAVVPEDAAVEIASADGTAVFSPEADGTYLLVPGDYAYSAWAEGCIAIEGAPFTVPAREVPESDAIIMEGTDLPPAEEAEPAFTLEIVMEPNPSAFEQFRIVDGVVVTVTAGAGAFPADAALSVEKVPVEKQAEADAAVEDVRADEAVVAVSYTFDIKVLDAEGNELQPAEGFNVSVSFALAEVADENLDTSVYHITEDESGDLTAEALNTVEDAEAETVSAETGSFSLYTVEFTYNTLKYVLQGGANVPLQTILDAVGLKGEAESASVSNAALFSVESLNETMTVVSHAPFTTEEWLRVTIGGVAYEITVTDDGAANTFYTYNGKRVDITATAVTADADTLSASASQWYVVKQNIKFTSRPMIVGDVNLILVDGATLTAPYGIRLSRGNRLTVYGQTKGTGKLLVEKDGLILGHAAIGGNIQESAGAFMLYGGEVSATGYTDGAGIGGGDSGAGGDVTVFGGKLTVKGGRHAAGIGGGLSGSQYGTFTLWGGEVTVTGGEYGAGIGGGENFNDEFGNEEYGGNGGQVSLWGGVLFVNGGKYAAAIGGGYCGGGGTVQIGGDCQIFATAGAKRNNDNIGIQAIGRGELTKAARAQSEGTVVFDDSVTVRAGESADKAVAFDSFNRLEGCRKPYVQIRSGGSLSYIIDKQINQVMPDKQTDKIDVQDASGKSIISAKPGEQFRAIVTLSNSVLVSLKATYNVGGATRTLAEDSKSQKGDVWTYTFTMPSAVEGGVTVKAEVERRTFTIKWPAASQIQHGTISVTADDDHTKTIDNTTLAVPDGARVRLLTEPDTNAGDYFIQKIEAKGETSGKVYASLVNDDKTNIATTDAEEEWLFMMPAENVTISVNFAEGCHYINKAGIRKVRRYYHKLSGSYEHLTLNGEGSEAGWYIVPPNTTVNVSCRVDVTADVNLILCDGAKLNANDGIFVAKRLNASLTIWAQKNGTGKLYADATGSKWAGIGGNSRDSSGNITINGGQIEAKGGENAPGIGSGQYGSIDKIEINVPKGMSDSFTYVEATGGRLGAGIGGGEDSNGGDIVINGGKVYAYGGYDAAGIGGGDGGSNDRTTINGGKVYAYGGRYGAGIGGGNYYYGGGAGGTVVINGGETRAYGGVNGAGVGGGEEGSAAHVTVNGGYLYAQGGEYAAGIGGGEKEPGGTFIIYGGRVNAYGGEKAAGIGGAEDEKGGSVYFYGGHVLAACGDGENYLTAIGAGKGESDDGSITFGSGMCVRSASSFNAVQNAPRVSAGNRDSACKHSIYAIIETCTHTDGEGGYESISPTQHRAKVCAYCTPSEVLENHTWDLEGTRCTKCKYSREHTVFIHDYELLSVEVTADDIAVDRYGNDHDVWMGKILEGQKAVIKITPKDGYEVSGGLNASGAVVTQSTDAATGTRTFSFTMPHGDVIFQYGLSKLGCSAHLFYSAAMGSAWFASTSNTVIYRTAGSNAQFTVRIKNDNYVVSDVRFYRRNADGTNGEDLTAGHIKKINTAPPFYVYEIVDFPCSLNIVVTFGRVCFAQIYHVLKTFDEEDGRLIWPDEEPDPLEDEARREYHISIFPNKEAVPEGMNYNDYELVGYRWDVYSQNEGGITPLSADSSYEDRLLSITDEHEALYVYYAPKNARLTICDANGNPLSGYTDINVPIGTPLLAYLKNTLHLSPGKIDGLDMRWATQRQGSYTYMLLTEATTMPSGSLKIVQVDPREYVHVLVDLNPSDVYLYELKAERGAFWGNSFGDTDDAVRWHKRIPNSTTEEVYMDASVPRSTRVQMGEALPNALVNAMQGVMRPGYKLTGWKVIKKDETIDLDLSDGLVADPDYFYDDKDRTYTGKHTNDIEGRMYHYILLVPQWELRDALVVYDAGEGSWSDGSKTKTEVIRANTYNNILLEDQETPTRNNGGWTFNSWEAAMSGRRYHPSEELVYNIDSIKYPLKLDMDKDIARSTDPNAKNIIRMNAVYYAKGLTVCPIYFRNEVNGDLIRDPYPSVDIRSGEPNVSFSVIIDEGTHVIDAAGNKVDFFDNPTREGYTFLGWSTDFGGEPRTVIDFTVYRLNPYVNLYACWQENPHSLRLNLAGGGWPEGNGVTTSYKYGETIPWDALVPVKRYYDFAGWQMDDGSELPATMPHADVRATAQWTDHVYTMYFVSADSEPHIIRAVRGTNIADQLPGDLEPQEGCIFDGWYPENPPTTMPGEDATYTARWLTIPEKPGAPELEVVDFTTLGVVSPDAAQVYSIDGGATWLAPTVTEATETTPADVVMRFEGLIPGTTYRVIAKMAAKAGVSIESEVSDPAEATLPRAVRVRLDLGSYDLVAATDADPAHVASMNLWSDDNVDPYISHFDKATPVRLTWEQPRQFTMGEGDAVTLDQLLAPTRDGYVLEGWSNQSDVKLDADNPLDVIEANFDAGDHVGTLDDPCVITLSARWEPRNADITYNVEAWKDGAPVSSRDVFDVPFGGTVTITEALPVAPVGKRLKYWKLRDSDWWKLYPGDSVAYDLNIVSDVGIEDGENNAINLEPVFEDKPQTTGLLIFDIGSYVTKNVAFAIPAGAESVDIHLIPSVGGTRIEYADGTLIGSVPDGIREGHTFTGWYERADGGDQAATVTIGRGEDDEAENRTFYAGWRVNSYALTYDLNGGAWPEGMNPQTSYTYGATIDWDSLAPVREHYDFVGWNPQPETMPADNLIVKAQWMLHPYALTFDLNGGAWPEGFNAQTNYTYEETIDWESLTPVREHYDFVGWNPQPETMPGNDTTVTAQWKEHVYTMSFINIDGETYSIRAVKGANIADQLPGDPEPQEGYVFDGWSPANPPTTMPGEDSTYTPKRLYVHVLLDVNGCDVNAGEDSALWGDYWSARDSYGNEPVGRQPDNEDDGKVSDRVYMDAAQVRSFRAELGDPLPEATRAAMYGAIRPGWRLAGWEVVQYRSSADFDPEAGFDVDYRYGARAYFNYRSGADQGRRYTYIILRAKWELRDALVVYDAGEGSWSDGSKSKTEVIPVNTFNKLLLEDEALPTRNNGGWRFYCWTLATTGDKYTTSRTLSYYDSVKLEDLKLVLDEDMARSTDPDAKNIIRMTASYEARSETYCAVYFRNEVGGSLIRSPFPRVTIPRGEGNVSFSVTVNDGTQVIDAAGNEVDAYDNPTREGYTFLGWSTEFGGEPQTIIDFNVPRTLKGSGSNSVNLYACWQVNTYARTFDLNGGAWPEGVNPQTSYTYGATIDWDGLTPVRQHYDFEGWDVQPETMPGNDLTVTAQWTPHVYTLTFTSLGEVYHEISGIYGAEIAQPENPTREDLVFEGWEPECPLTMPDEDMTIAAIWREKQPDAPKIKSQDHANLSIDTIEGQEYSIDNGKNWHRVSAAGLSYGGLKPGATYNVITRIPGREGLTLDSHPSEPTTVTLPADVAVRLDLGVYDTVAEDLPSFSFSWISTGIGSYWGNDWPRYAQTPAGYMDEYQVRSFLAAQGEKLDMRFMNAAYREEAYYELDGWYTKDGVKWEADMAVSVQYCDSSELYTDRDGTKYYIMTLKARWRLRQYALTLDLNGGEWPEGVNPQTSYTYGSTIDWDGLAPVREHYDFGGWDVQPETMPDRDITAMAQWTPHMYTLTFTVDGEAFDTATGEYGAEVTLPECGIDAPDGCSFAGWQVGEETLAAGATIAIAGDMDISAVWKLIRPRFRTHSVLLSGQIGINFFMELPELEGVDYADSYMQFTINSKNGATTRDPFDSSDRDVNGRGYYGFTVFVSSIQMAAPITAVFHYGDGQTVEQTYSVQDYIVAYEAVADNFDATTTALVRAIADYGHYAQPALSMANGWRIGADYAEMDTYYRGSLNYDAVASAVKPYALVKALSQSDIEKVNFDINLLSQTNIRVFFAPKPGYDGGLTATVEGNGATAKKLSDGRWRVQIDDISAHQLGKMYGVKAQTSTGTASVQVSVLSYVDAVLRSDMDARYKDAVSALYYYYKAAMDYRNAHNY